MPLGGVLDAVVANGANNLGGIAFSLQDVGAAEDEARRQSVADALSKAQVLANAAGVELGALVSISEGGMNMVQPRMMMEAMSADTPVPIATGAISVSAQVTLVFEISD